MWSDDVTKRVSKAVRTGVYTVRVTRSFEMLRIGEVFENTMNPRVRVLIDAGFLEVISDGASETGPGTAGQGDPGGSQEDTAPESSAGAEPGEDPSAG